MYILVKCNVWCKAERYTAILFSCFINESAVGHLRNQCKIMHQKFRALKKRIGGRPLVEPVQDYATEIWSFKIRKCPIKYMKIVIRFYLHKCTPLSALYGETD